MEGCIERLDILICSGARRLTGYQRRLFMAEVTTELCECMPVKPSDASGGHANGLLKGLHEVLSGIRCLESFRRTRPFRSQREGPATGCGYPCDRRAS